jgi:hypothetical protein
MKGSRYSLFPIQFVPDTVCSRYSLFPIQFVPDTICSRYNLCRYNLCRYNLYMNPHLPLRSITKKPVPGIEPGLPTMSSFGSEEDNETILNFTPWVQNQAACVRSECFAPGPSKPDTYLAHEAVLEGENSSWVNKKSKPIKVSGMNDIQSRFSPW